MARSRQMTMAIAFDQKTPLREPRIADRPPRTQRSPTCSPLALPVAAATHSMKRCPLAQSLLLCGAKYKKWPHSPKCDKSRS